ncbi:A24 family peptidase [Amycolatopsis sp. NBC_01480]|uniref:A24 family peptidase n=1 Tax=Amycolatopsis sp. NBC_01480 TaxID=2903562 RepID=UPI002E287F7A|nr:A24 family peptidase [Amycolatopsis sp. NBC_01480]
MVTVGWLAAYAGAGAACGAALSELTQRSLLDRAGRVVGSWWLAAAVTGCVLAVLGWRVGVRWELALYWLLVVLGVPLAIIDFTDRRLPRLLVYPLLIGLLGAAVVLCLVRGDAAPGIRAVAGMAALCGVFLLGALIVPGGIGAGDVRLAAVAGLVAGWSGWTSVAATLLMSLVYAALLLGLLRLARWKSAPDSNAAPFGPCLLAGLLTAVVVTGG